MNTLEWLLLNKYLFLNLKVADKTWTFRGLQSAFCTAINIEIKENVSKLTLRFCRGKTMKNLKFYFFNFPVILLGKFLHLRLKSCLMMNLAKLKGLTSKIAVFSWYLYYHKFPNLKMIKTPRSAYFHDPILFSVWLLGTL